MDKIAIKKALLHSTMLSEGTNVEYNEEAILDEYRSQEAKKSSLSIKALSIFGGMLGSLTFFAFIALAGLYDSPFGLIGFGTGLLIAAIWLNKIQGQFFLDTLSISLYLTGVAMVVFGLGVMNIDQDIIALIASLIALCSLLITQNYIQSFVSVLMINVSLIFIIFSSGRENLFYAYVPLIALLVTYFFLNEAKVITAHRRLSRLYDPIRIGLTFSFLMGLAIIGNGNIIPISLHYFCVSSIIMCLVILYLVYTILKVIEPLPLSITVWIYVLSLLVLIPIVFAPAIVGAMIIILLSFLVYYRAGFVLGIVAFVYFVGQYYYDLNFTLLTKSILLFSSGIVFLLLYFFISKRSSSNANI